MTDLVTGMSGFAGQHLARLLEQQGREPAPLSLSGRRVDLTDAAAVSSAVREIFPDRVYHLAALSSVARSWREQEAVFAVNRDGFRNLLSAVVEHAPGARVLLVSTGAVYGEGEAGRCFGEDDAVSPLNPYAASKVAAEVEAELAFQLHDLDVRRVRPLGHTGPGQKKGFVTPDLACQAAAVKLGRQEPVIRTGGLETAREFADVRDVVRAYATIMERGEPGMVYNLATNCPYTIRAVGEALIEAAGIEAALQPDPAKVRPADESSPRLDTGRIKKLGFDFEIPFSKTMADVLDEWMKILRGES